MTGRLSFLLACVALGTLLLAAPERVLAYGGPGSIVSGVGAFFAVVVAIFASLFGFVWFPVKRFLRWMKGGRRANEAADGPEASEEAVDS